MCRSETDEEKWEDPWSQSWQVSSSQYRASQLQLDSSFVLFFSPRSLDHAILLLCFVFIYFPGGVPTRVQTLRTLHEGGGPAKVVLWGVWDSVSCHPRDPFNV